MSDDRKDASQEEIAWALEKAQELEARFDKGISEARDANRRLEAGKRSLAAFVEKLASGERISLDFISQGVTKFSKELPIEKGKKSEEVPDTLYCSFCGKSQHEVKKLIAGPTVFICNECIALCTDIIAEEA